MDRGNSFSNGRPTDHGPCAQYRDEGWDYRPVTIFDWQFRDYR